MLSLADAYSVPLVLHIEPVNPGDDSNRIVEIKRWYQAVCEAYKNVQLIAAHTGMMSPADLEELLLRCPNLHADFKVLHSVRAINGFAHLHGVNDLDFRFFEEWAALMERFPDRFVFGSDWKDQRHGYTETSYAAHIREVRRIIGSLAPHVQQRIAYFLHAIGVVAQNMTVLLELPQRLGGVLTVGGIECLLQMTHRMEVIHTNAKRLFRLP